MEKVSSECERYKEMVMSRDKAVKVAMPYNSFIYPSSFRLSKVLGEPRAVKRIKWIVKEKGIMNALLGPPPPLS